MTTEDPVKLWYVARDGKQTGPISDAEIRAIAAHGYFRPADLVWRPGFPEWRPALAVFPAPAAAPASAPDRPQPPPNPAKRVEPEPTTARTQPGAAGTPLRPGGFEVRPAAGAGTPFQPRPFQSPAAAEQPVMHQPTTEQPTTVRPSGPGPSGGQPMARPQSTTGPGLAPHGGDVAQPLPYAYRPANPDDGATRAPTTSPDAVRERLAGQRPARPRTNRMAFAALMVTVLAIVGGVYVAAEPTLQQSGALEPVKRSIASVVAMFSGKGNDIGELETKLQATAHWPVIKREFPDWYGERLREAAQLTAEKKSSEEISKVLAERIVALRRQNAAQALSASAPRLLAVASAFLDNLRQLKQTSPNVCYTFISQGELTPAVLEKLRVTGTTPPPAIQVQVAAIFEAIAEGRKTPIVHEKPQKNDYDLLMAELGKLGWTQDDIAVFANPRSLARTEPGRVCQMVQDWFVAHIAIGDANTRERLIGETLRPVVSG